MVLDFIGQLQISIIDGQIRPAVSLHCNEYKQGVA